MSVILANHKADNTIIPATLCDDVNVLLFKLKKKKQNRTVNLSMLIIIIYFFYN